MIENFRQNYCKVPYVVFSNLHRIKLDVNRNIEEAAQGNTIAEEAWLHFHNFIQVAQKSIINTMGTVKNSVDEDGARGIMIDLHGYSGRDWDANDGGNFIHWGYRLETDSLDQDQSCPLDSVSPSDTSTLGTLSHARFLPNQSYECLVRGPGSLGSRVSARLDLGQCGKSLPSYEFPNPKAVTSDSEFCRNAETCNYYSGGTNVKLHEHLDWHTLTGTKFNVVQTEVPRCIRFDSTTHEPFADSLSIALCSFLRDVFPADIFLRETC